MSQSSYVHSLQGLHCFSPRSYPSVDNCIEYTNYNFPTLSFQCCQARFFLLSHCLAYCNKYLMTTVFGSAGKESACNVGDLGSIPGLGRSSGEGKGYQLQYFGMENSMDCTVHGVAKSRTQLSNCHFTFGRKKVCEVFCQRVQTWRLFSLNGLAHHSILSTKKSCWYIQVFNKYLLNE